MARPAMPVDMLSDSTRISNEEREARAKEEQRLKGKSNKINPPKNWSPERKKLFRFIVRECFPPDTLCNLDYYLLEELAISLDRKAKFDAVIDEDLEELTDVQTRQARESCRKSALDCMRELGMSRAARAKVADKAASMAKQRGKPETVFDIMSEDDED